VIKKVIEIKKNVPADDRVELSWFDMQKPNLSAMTDKNVSFILKVKFTHLHDNDILVCEDGYAIEIARGKDDVYVFEFSDHISFAKNAYAIGNRHQPICIEDYKITVLDDIALGDIVGVLQSDDSVKVTKSNEYFRPNINEHHSH